MTLNDLFKSFSNYGFQVKETYKMERLRCASYTHIFLLIIPNCHACQMASRSFIELQLQVTTLTLRVRGYKCYCYSIFTKYFTQYFFYVYSYMHFVEAAEHKHFCGCSFISRLHFIYTNSIFGNPCRQP